MKIITPITIVPKELRGLWKIQYAPIERLLQEAFDMPDTTEQGKKNAKAYKNATIAGKMLMLDRLHAASLGVEPSIF